MGPTGNATFGITRSWTLSRLWSRQALRIPSRSPATAMPSVTSSGLAPTHYQTFTGEPAELRTVGGVIAGALRGDSALDHSAGRAPAHRDAGRPRVHLRDRIRPRARLDVCRVLADRVGATVLQPRARRLVSQRSRELHV